MGPQTKLGKAHFFCNAINRGVFVRLSYSFCVNIQTAVADPLNWLLHRLDSLDDFSSAFHLLPIFCSQF
jgi:hypothetical protein